MIDPVIHIYNDRFTNNDGMITFAEPGEVNANRLSPQHAGEMSWDLRWVPSGVIKRGYLGNPRTRLSF